MDPALRYQSVQEILDDLDGETVAKAPWRAPAPVAAAGSHC